MDRRRLLGLLGAAPFVSTSIAHGAEDYPAQPIKALVGFPAGSGADIQVRYYCKKLADLCGKPVIVENKPGATGNIAVALAANAKPDGYTLLFQADPNMAGGPFLFKDLPFNAERDFTPVALLSESTFLLIVAPNAPFKTIDDLTRHLKSQPDKVKYGYTNQVARVGTEVYLATVGARAVPVSYRASPDAVGDLISGNIDFLIIDGTFGSGQLRSGRVKALAVTAAARHPALPDIPTMAEAGVKDFEFASWWAVWVPKETQADVVRKLEGWFGQIVSLDETREFLAPTGGTPLKGGSQAAREKLRAGISKWKRATEIARIEPQ